MRAWSHLPNAKHIDWALGSVEANPKKWEAAWEEPPGLDVKYVAWEAARHVANKVAWNATRAVYNDADWRIAQTAARGAILALIAWDHSAKYLKMTPDQLRVWHALSDDPACILLLPAVIVLQEEMEMV